MAKKSILLLIAIVLVPLLLLAWFGVRMAKNEQHVLQSQFDALVMVQLRTIDSLVVDYFLLKEKELLDLFSVDISDHSLLQKIAEQAANIRQVFVLSEKGQRIFPDETLASSSKTQKFLQRTAHIWLDTSLLYQSSLQLDSHEKSLLAGKASIKSATAKQQLKSKFSKPSIEIQQQKGWYVWHSNNEINHIFWWKTQAGNTIGVELYPARVKADVIALLPDTRDDDPVMAEARVRLVDDHEAIVYQWGNYQPKENQNYLALLPLSHPLGSWRLLYFSDYRFQVSLFNWFNIAIGLIVVGGLLAMMAYYFYREHTREIRLAKQRVNFVNQVSHELKTPLTNIRLYAELLEEQLTDSEDEKQHRYIDIITNESQRLSRLISNVLSFSRAERDALKLNPANIVIDDVIRQVIEHHQAALSTKGIAITFDANAPDEVHADADCVEQIINNLISNAEKYAASGNRIDIKSVHEAGYTIVTVRDFGPGITAKEANKIFTPFYRGSNKLTDGVTGTGIGLSIARQLAQMHGGDIRFIKSDPGSCFTVTLNTAKTE